MEPRRTPARRAGLAALAALLVLGASACSGGLVGKAPAATVNGSEISQTELDDMVTGSRKLLEVQIAAARASLEEQTAAGQAQTTAEQLEAEIEKARAPLKHGNDTYPTAGAAAQLTELITRKIYEQAVEAAGGKITAEDRSSAKDSLVQQDASFTDAPKIIQDTYIGTGAATIALQRLVPEELQDALAAAGDAYEQQLKDAYAQQSSASQQVCAVVIVSADEATAGQAAERVRNGEAAATVAAEVTPPGTEAAADPQCFAASQVATALGEPSLTAAKGDVLGPLPYGDGTFAILVVDSLKTPSFDEVRETIAQQIPDEFSQKAQDDIGEYIRKLVVRSADVTVDPRFGTWDRKALAVVPPVAPADPDATTTTSTTAVAPVAGS